MKQGSKWIAVLFCILSVGQALAGEKILLKAKTIHEVKKVFIAAESQTPALYLVQWKQAIREDEKSQIANLGLKIISYIPEDTLLVYGPGNVVAKAAQFAFIKGMLSYDASMKVDQELTKFGVFSADREILLNVRSLATIDDLRSYFSEVKQLGENLFVGKTTLAQVWNLAKRNDVLWIERLLAAKTMDMDLGAAIDASEKTDPPPAYTGYESGTKLLGLERTYGSGFHGEGMIVAYADTGLDIGSLQGINRDFEGQVKEAYAMGLLGSSWADPMSHGTHVAGSMVGTGANSAGKIRGGAYGAKLFVEGLWSDVLNNISIPGITELFDKAYGGGARVHSNSWGAPDSSGRYDSWAQEADKFLFEHDDFLAVFAAGNDGKDLNNDGVIDEGSVSTPATAKNVLSVGASKNYFLTGGIQKPMKQLRNGTVNWGVEPIASSLLSEDPRGLAAFSSRGPTADGRLKPEIVAPGTNIVSARSQHPKAEIGWGIYDDHYLYMGGTSMATPLTSGAVTVLRQYLLQNLNTDHVSSALLKASLMNSADDLYPGQFGLRAQGQEEPTPRPNNHEGWGRVDLDNVIGAQSVNYQFHDELQGLGTGESKRYTVDVKTQAKPLRVTMVYTDAPGDIAAAKALVNDLDLVVTTPSGQKLYPNGQNAPDKINNSEEVDVLSPELGSYQIEVQGANVPMGKNGKQPYALVISGTF